MLPSNFIQSRVTATVARATSHLDIGSNSRQQSSCCSNYTCDYKCISKCQSNDMQSSIKYSHYSQSNTSDCCSCEQSDGKFDRYRADKESENRYGCSVISNKLPNENNVLRERNNNCPSSNKLPRSENYSNSKHVGGKENYFRETQNSSVTNLQHSKKSQSLEDIMKPLNVERLRPIRQKTRNVVVSILEDETVCLEFIKSKANCEFVMEVFKVSSDGIKITTYQPNGKIGIPLQASPSVTPSSAVSYAFSGLPQRLWKKYQYADKFVRLVRMKTPKVI